MPIPAQTAPKVETLFFVVREEAPSRIPPQHLARFQEERFRRVARALADAIVARELPIKMRSHEDEQAGVLVIEYALPINVDRDDKDYVYRTLQAGARLAKGALTGIVDAAGQRYAALTGSCAPSISGALFDAAKAMMKWELK